ncbi:L-threonylcarbamoyladenylate synthase [Geosmithia morbida]|uniref:Threonylcarbamoyl-AMP synthase n=1 Tax=Geosmithia morbida TaxID=1094350 RepID=A0A9P4YY86_9HYPO|nr:L-threonylcarbamoyladenylate synthase [Geosmithia morbida]KAF4123984.1 L-threonylcarbamoyladenylate synthase [Geosmithia morbida]
METRIVRIPGGNLLGRTAGGDDEKSSMERWDVERATSGSESSEEALRRLGEAAYHLRTSDTPVGFPTETVYGLGADATRSGAVRGIYAAKGRPSDNPLIIHVSDLEMLRAVMQQPGSESRDGDDDPIPLRYKALIDRFWPGPLTILLPNADPSKLAPEVTAGLPTFGVRMPSTPLARTLIKLAGVPLAAPSANASTKPSPTTAQHVKHDLDGRIELILDGGACSVGVESTVVDGLCDPPAVLRPGGVGIDDIRSCPGWEGVVKAYRDHADEGKSAPRAPGMKYKHYSPRARVVLYEASLAGEGLAPADTEMACAVEGSAGQQQQQQQQQGPPSRKIGVIRTQRWKTAAAGLPTDGDLRTAADDATGQQQQQQQDGDEAQPETPYSTLLEGRLVDGKGQAIGYVMDIDLGKDTKGIAQGLFSALRELDLRGADLIFVDGIEDEMDIAAAVMNRLRKAASEIRR